MGEVYLAENIQMHKRYALKVLPAALSRDPQFIGRFKVEARVMADLDHPHIVRVHHMGAERDLFYLAMDFIGSENGEPRTLEDLIETGTGRVSEADVKRIALQICAALEYAHGFRNGVVHRDLKPSNILLDEAGEVKIGDFGLAKVLGDAYLKSVIERSVSLSIGSQMSIGDMDTRRPRYERTSTRSILGTYDFMSPEQKAGRPVTAQSDLYAVGMMLYRMLTGQKAEGRFRLPSAFNCGKRWDAVIEKCLQQDPADRPASAFALRHLIERIVPKHEETRRGWFLAAVAALSILALSAGAWVVLRDRSSLDGNDLAAQSTGVPPPIEPLAEEPLPMPETVQPPETDMSSQPHAGDTDVQDAVGMPPVIEEPAEEELPESLPPLPAFGSIRVSAEVSESSQGDYLRAIKNLSVGTVVVRKVSLPWETNGLPPGPIWVRLAVQGFNLASQEVNVAAGSTNSAAFRLFPMSRPTATNPPPKASDPAPGKERDVKIAPGSTMRFRWIPATTSPEWIGLTGKTNVVLGSSLAEPGHESGEARRPVVFSNGFWMGQSEVTQEQWRRIMDGNPSVFTNLESRNGPVDSVRWSDATNFVERLNRKLAGKQCAVAGLSPGERFRLPDEDEWEHACRAGSSTPFHPPGEANPRSVAWYVVNGRFESHPVGERDPNEWGLHDMHGNVMEWCRSRRTGAAPVLKGGGFNSVSSDCRAAYRYRPADPEEQRTDRGLRLILGR